MSNSEIIHKKKKFEQLFILMFPKVKAFAFKLLKSEDDAEDVAQDVFVKLWDNPEIWENRNNLSAYIYTMVRNQIFNFLKHRNIISSYHEQLTQNPIYSDSNIYDDIYAKELDLLYKLTLSQMPEQRRKIYLMSRQDDLTNKEIAEQLQLSVRTIERHLYLAMQDFKKIILIAFFFYFY